MSTPGMYSLQRRLLWLLGVAIVVVALMQAGLAYRAALSQADAAFDAQMKQLALAVRAGRFDGSQSLGGIEEQDFVVQSWSADGRIIYQSTRRRLAPARRRPGYSIARTGDKTYRVYATDGRGAVVQVSQDMDERARRARRQALGHTWPVALLGGVLVLMAGWVIRRSLAPVQRVSRALAQRRPGQLEPIENSNLPSEVQPVVDELNRLLERVSKTLQVQQDFIADAAHELRSPITAIKLQIQNLRRGALPAQAGAQAEAVEQALQRLESGVERAARMTDQLIHLAQHQAPLSDIEPAQAIDLGQVAGDIIVQMTPQADDKSIDLGLLQNDNLMVRGWPEAVRVLARNLIGNAIKYTPDGGQVDVSVTSENDLPSLIVEDSGPGIDAAQRERVLDRFFRARTGAAHSSDGSGLGLAIVKAVAQRHGAQLQLARSPRLGGLRIRVQFPAALSRPPNNDTPLAGPPSTDQAT